MTLNNVKPRSAMKPFSRSTVSATDLLLSLVMTEDRALSIAGSVEGSEQLIFTFSVQLLRG
jgi:hypothetical protein